MVAKWQQWMPFYIDAFMGSLRLASFHFSYRTSLRSRINLPYTPGRFGKVPLPPIQAHSLVAVDCAAEHKQIAKKAIRQRMRKPAREPSAFF